MKINLDILKDVIHHYYYLEEYYGLKFNLKQIKFIETQVYYIHKMFSTLITDYKIVEEFQNENYLAFDIIKSVTGNNTVEIGREQFIKVLGIISELFTDNTTYIETFKRIIGVSTGKSKDELINFLKDEGLTMSREMGKYYYIYKMFLYLFARKKYDHTYFEGILMAIYLYRMTLDNSNTAEDSDTKLSNIIKDFFDINYQHSVISVIVESLRYIYIDGIKDIKFGTFIIQNFTEENIKCLLDMFGSSLDDHRTVVVNIVKFCNKLRYENITDEQLNKYMQIFVSSIKKNNQSNGYIIDIKHDDDDVVSKIYNKPDNAPQAAVPQAAVPRTRALYNFVAFDFSQTTVLLKHYNSDIINLLLKFISKLEREIISHNSTGISIKKLENIIKARVHILYNSVVYPDYNNDKPEDLIKKLLDINKTNETDETKIIVDNLVTGYNEILVAIKKLQSQGGKQIFKYIKELYKCNDNRYRRAFLIKGHGNTKFVISKGRIVKASSLKSNKKNNSKDIKINLKDYIRKRINEIESTIR